MAKLELETRNLKLATKNSACGGRFAVLIFYFLLLPFRDKVGQNTHAPHHPRSICFFLVRRVHDPHQPGSAVDRLLSRSADQPRPECALSLALYRPVRRAGRSLDSGQSHFCSGRHIRPRCRAFFHVQGHGAAWRVDHFVFDQYHAALRHLLRHFISPRTTHHNQSSRHIFHRCRDYRPLVEGRDQDLAHE